jgi:ribosomal protein L37AE/L43A
MYIPTAFRITRIATNSTWYCKKCGYKIYKGEAFYKYKGRRQHAYRESCGPLTH